MRVQQEETSIRISYDDENNWTVYDVRFVACVWARHRNFYGMTIFRLKSVGDDRHYSDGPARALCSCSKAVSATAAPSANRKAAKRSSD